jgi:arginyl-tRNA synthetase
MIERELAGLIRTAIEDARDELGTDGSLPDIEVTKPRQKEHGDYATNVALALGAAGRRNPREVAEILRRHFPPSELVASVEVAGPGSSTSRWPRGGCTG